VPPNKGLVSENVVFRPGQVATRLGFSVAFDPDVPISAMLNWLSSLGNNLVYYRTSDNSVQLVDITNPPTETALIAGDLVGYAATFAEAGARLYCSFFSSAGAGASGARVVTFQNSAYVSDLAFQPPITYTPSAPTETAAGVVTAGLHYVGYRIEYRSGFITRPSPDSGNGTVPNASTFQPIAFTATGSMNLEWTLNTTWPVGAINVYMIMSPVSSPAQYFLVPGAVQPVVGGVASSITFTVDVSDETLFSTTGDVTQSVFFLTNSVLNVPQFFPQVAFSHGDRMVYVTTVSDGVGNQSGALYISNKQAFQELFADQSLIQLPGLKDITTGISLDGIVYVIGPQWVYRTIDNGAAPSTWPAPSLVDGRRGTLAIRGAVVSPSGTYAWIASQDGLYFFQGAFPSLPISYYQQTDWDRINWDVAQVIDIKDDPTVKKVYVLAALDSNTTPSHMLTWDYTNGFGAEQVQYSVDFLQGYNMGSIEVVKNGLPNMPVGVPQRKELWVAPSDEAPILRRNSENDDDPYLDNAFPIFSNYETALFPPQGSAGEIYQHHGVDTRVKGDGNLALTAYTLDHDKSFECLEIALSESPGKIIHRSFDLISEGVSLLFTQGQNLVVDGDMEGE
jgi:hypothetical protein